MGVLCILLAIYDFYQVARFLSDFSQNKKTRKLRRDFYAKIYAKKIFLSYLRAAIIFRFPRRGDDQTTVSFTEKYSMALRRAPLAGVPGHYPGRFSLPSTLLYRGGFRYLQNATLSVRHLKRDAGSGHLGGPAILVLLTSCAPFPPLTYRGR